MVRQVLLAVARLGRDQEALGLGEAPTRDEDRGVRAARGREHAPDVAALAQVRDTLAPLEGVVVVAHSATGGEELAAGERDRDGVLQLVAAGGGERLVHAGEAALDLAFGHPSRRLPARPRSSRRRTLRDRAAKPPGLSIASPTTPRRRASPREARAKRAPHWAALGRASSARACGPAAGDRRVRCEDRHVPGQRDRHSRCARRRRPPPAGCGTATRRASRAVGPSSSQQDDTASISSASSGAVGRERHRGGDRARETSPVLRKASAPRARSSTRVTIDICAGRSHPARLADQPGSDVLVEAEEVVRVVAAA